MDNLDLWNKVDKTNPAHTKGANIGKMKITAIDPQQQRKRATEMFGPFGIGWGVKDARWDHITLDENTILALYNATMWFKQAVDRTNPKEIETGEFAITSAVKVCYMTRGDKAYRVVDDEYAKKGATDAMTKGLSMLGFNSDVFEGKFDDNRYVNERKQEEAAKANPPVVATQETRDKTLTYCDEFGLEYKDLNAYGISKFKTAFDLLTEMQLRTICTDAKIGQIKKEGK